MAILRIPDGQGGYVTVPAIKGEKGDKGDKGDAGASSWKDIADKPTTFTPAVHSHTLGDVSGLLARFGGGDVTLPTATGDWSTALGDEASAAGQQSTAVGSSAEATKGASTALGNWAKATGVASTALGNSASAAGQQSTALGNRSSAGGDYSYALGEQASATGTGAQAIASYSKATKNWHTVIGTGATDENIPTNIPDTVVIGKAGVPVYLAGRDIFAELDKVMREARAYTDALIAVGNTAALDGKLHIVYE